MGIERRKADGDIVVKIQACAEQIAEEKAGHGDTKEDLAIAVQDMTAKIEAERLLRDQALADVKQGIEDLNIILSEEKIERGQDITRIHDELEEANCRTNQLIDGVKQDIQAESSARAAALEHLGKLCAQHKAMMEDFERACEEKLEHLANSQTALRGDLENEVQLHADDAAKTAEALGTPREAVSDEVQERKTQFEDLMGNVNTVRDMVETEKHDRAEALSDATYAISQVRDHVDKESHERKHGEEEMKLENQALVMKLAAEKERTDHEIDTLKSQHEKNGTGTCHRERRT